MNNSSPEKPEGVGPAYGGALTHNFLRDGYEILTSKAHRMLEVRDFGLREVGAYELFRQVAEASLLQAFGSEGAARHDGRSVEEVVVYPTISYDPAPGDSSQRRQIILDEGIQYEGGMQVRSTPGIIVHTTETLENGLTPEVDIVRTELDALTGRSREGMLESLLTEGDEAWHEMVRSQAEYIKWLQIAAGAVGVQGTFYIPMPDSPNGDSPSLS